MYFDNAIYWMDSPDRGRRRNFAAMLYKHTGIVSTSGGGWTFFEVLPNLATLRGQVRYHFSWLHSDVPSQTVYFNLNNDDHEIARITPDGIEIFKNGGNPDGVILDGSRKMKAIKFLPDVDPEEADQLLVDLLVNNLTCPQGDRFLILSWMSCFLLIDFASTRPMTRFEGPSGSGKTTASKIISALLYGEPQHKKATDAANYTDGSQNPLIVLNNIEVKQMTDELTTFMLTSITGISKEKRKSGTDSETISERTKCLLNTTGIKPLCGELSEILSRSFIINFDLANQASDCFLESEVIAAIQQKRDLIISAIMKRTSHVLAMIRDGAQKQKQIMRLLHKTLPDAVYGGNASGKTNLFKALSFVKGLVVKGTQPDSLIPVEPFRLDAKGGEQPTHFSLELLVDDTIYEFSFAATRKAIVEERLVEISSASERVLYDRRNGNPNFDRSLEKDQFLQFAFKGTRDNQLFLTNSVSQKVDLFRPVYNWFKDKLQLVAPDARFGAFKQYLDEDHPLYETLNELLPQLDTGIKHLGGDTIPFDNLPLPEPLKTKLQEDVKEGMTVRMLTHPVNERFVVTRKNGELIAKKLVTYHPRADGTEAKFDIRDESDGSQRVIDLLPAFLELSSADSKKVYVIDEIDRSMHTLLTRTLIDAYLTKCSPETRAQVLFTTHDVLLMDQQLLRRDEMWVTERDISGNSNLLSFSEYKDVCYDKDIRKSYLQGRLGGIPRILAVGAMNNNACLVRESKGRS